MLSVLCIKCLIIRVRKIMFFKFLYFVVSFIVRELDYFNKRLMSNLNFFLYIKRFCKINVILYLIFLEK